MIITMTAMIALPASAADAAELINYYELIEENTFHLGSTGATEETSSNFFTSDYIKVEAGETLYLGPCNPSQNYQFYTYDAEKTPMTKVNGAHCTVVETLSNNSVIYSYTVEANAEYVRMSAARQYAPWFLLTRGQSFTSADLKTYADANVSITENLFDKATADPGYATSADTYKASGSHFSSQKFTVKKHDVIYVGPCDPSKWQLLFTNSSGTSTQIEVASMTQVDTFDNGQPIYAYRCTAAGTVRAVNVAAYNDFYLVTKNVPLTAQTYYSYWDNQENANLYNATLDKTGHFPTTSGGFSSLAKHNTTHFISVKENDTITFGPAMIGQSFHAMTFTNAKNGGEKVKETNLTTPTSSQLFSDGKSAIYTYKIPAGVSYIKVVNDTTYKNKFLVTKNNEFDIAEYNKITGNNETSIDDFEIVESVLNGQSALFCGDSICIGTQDEAEMSGWAGRIAKYYDLELYANNGVSGASLSTARDRYWNTDGFKQGRILWQVTREASYYYDYVILHGGVNDAWDKYPVGKMTDSFDVADFDTATYAGALEELFYYTIKYHGESAIGYLMNFYAPSCTSGYVSDMSEYFAVGKQICEKWDIPYFDMYNNAEITAALDFTTKANTNDYIHPIASGYDILYPFIAEWMETLEPYRAHKAVDHEKTVIACVGDSITKGEQSNDINRYSYPAQLQELLGEEDYEVLNLGWGGATAQVATPNPYKKTLQYKNLLQADPDIVVAKFGHNDAKEDNWDDSDHAAAKAAFKEDLYNMISEFQNLPSKPTVYMAYPTWALSSTGRTEIAFANGMLDAITEVAAELGCAIIDFRTPTVDQKQYFSSNGTNVHPNDDGYALMAELVYETLTGKDAPAPAEQDTAVEETDPTMPLIRNWKQYYDTVDQFRIETVEDVALFGDLIAAGYTFKDKTVYLMNDLDFTGIDFKPLGATTGEVGLDENPLYSRSFEGTFDGQYHTFSNVYISSMYYGAGLFPVTHGATIQNFGLASGRIEGFDVVGSIVGYGDHCTKMYNVWSAADVYAANNGKLYGIQGTGGIAANMRLGGEGTTAGTGSPTMTNVAYYGTVSANSHVAGISAWGQGVLLATNVVFGGTLDQRSKSSSATPFVRYNGTVTGKAANYFGIEGVIARSEYTADVTPVLLSKEAFSNGEAAYRLNAIDGAVWTVKDGYTIPWGDAATETHKVTLDSTVCYTDSTGALIQKDALDAARYWMLDGTITPAETISTFSADAALTSLTVEALRGDLNLSNDKDTSDVILLLQYINDWDVTIDTDLADVSGDGRVGIYDAVKLLQIIAQ